MKVKIFIEYWVKKEKRAMFFQLIPQLKEYHEDKWNINDFEIFEGTEQKNLFVEEFHIDNEEQYHEIKDDRLQENDPFFSTMHECIKGGKEKVNIWAFRKVDEM
ncbi:hypothetical protein [Halalkalibacterium ligniniphilum]|uniref:hypothetical protein n=1 Tax=Halalkalibacterium ligniniphilum TaxID=1134413 RepID=UPI00034871EB|nr:hypothetical protein [Halalkalibacterium ligniniphilum]